jgi:hypothetical protein
MPVLVPSVDRRPLILGPPLQRAPVALLERTAPLFEEERNAGGHALVAKVGDPSALERPRPGAGLAAADYPVNARKVQGRERSQQRLQRKEPRGGARLSQM